MTSTPIDPATLDRDALMARFWRVTGPTACPYEPSDQRYISQDEIAAAIGWTQTTVGRWLETRRLPLDVEYVLDKRRILRASFERWYAEREAA